MSSYIMSSLLAGVLVIFVTYSPTVVHGYFPEVGLTYQLLGYNSGDCATVHGASNETNAFVDIGKCLNVPSQRWLLRFPKSEKTPWRVPDASGDTSRRFTYVNEGSKMCLSVGEGLKGTADNTEVVQFECQDPTPDSQLWYTAFIDSRLTRNYRQIRNSNGKCLTVEDNQTVEGAIITVKRCVHEFWAYNQYWKYLDADVGRSNLK